jgi:nucleoside 2-deoxyribosyltransferase
MPMIYLAGPLFSVAEREFNQRLASGIRHRFPKASIVLPQDHAREIAGHVDFCDMMFRHALQSVEQCDVVVAVLDGPDADSGTCVEIGYAKARGKPVVGLRTDLRPSEDAGLNLMVARSCTSMVRRTEGDVTVERLVDEVSAALARLL